MLNYKFQTMRVKKTTTGVTLDTVSYSMQIPDNPLDKMKNVSIM